MSGFLFYFCMENKEKQAVEEREFPLQERQEDWKRSIPAQVFLNYFFSLHYLIRQAAEAFDLNKVTFFRDSEFSLNPAVKESVQQHLLNAWNTEYTMMATARLGDKTYLRNALHWTFPQACYSVFESLKAFLSMQGIMRAQEEHLEWEAGHWVTRKAYPEVISFYASGHPLRPQIQGLQYGHYKPSLQLADMLTESHAQVGQFLRTTRKATAERVRLQLQNNPATALRSQKTGGVLKRFTNEHWKQLVWRVGYTSIFSFLLRLRISANHREITRFVEADIDFNLFHHSLQYLVGYLNFVHEAYVAKAMGLENYTRFVRSLPAYLQNSFVQQRLEDYIVPLLEKKKVA